MRKSNMEQVIQQQDYDELLIEKNRYGAIWLHFAVRPRDNRNKVNFINA